MFSQPTSSAQLDEDKISSLALTARSVVALAELLSNKSDLQKVDATLQSIIDAKAEVESMRKDHLNDVADLEARAAEIENRRVSVENAHQENMATFEKAKASQLAAFNKYMADEQRKIDKANSDITEGLNFRALSIDSRYTDLNAQIQKADAREIEINNKIEAHNKRVDELKAWESKLAERHQAVSHLEQAAFQKG